MSIVDRLESPQPPQKPDRSLVRLVREELPPPDFEQIAEAAEQIIMRYAGKPEGAEIHRPEIYGPFPHAPLAADALRSAGILIRIKSEQGLHDRYVLNTDALKTRLSSQGTDDPQPPTGLVRLVQEHRAIPTDDEIARAAEQVIANYPDDPSPYGVPLSTLSQGVDYSSEAIDCLVGAGVLVQDEKNVDFGPDERFYTLEHSVLEGYLPVPTSSRPDSSQ